MRLKVKTEAGFVIILLSAVQDYLRQMRVFHRTRRGLSFYAYAAVWCQLAVFAPADRNKIACINLRAALVCENIHFQRAVGRGQRAEFAVFAERVVAEKVVVNAVYCRLAFFRQVYLFPQQFFLCEVKGGAPAFLYQARGAAVILHLHEKVRIQLQTVAQYVTFAVQVEV